MNRQSIHQQIEVLLKSITGKHDAIREHKGTIQQIDIDLFLQNLRQLYEALLMLNHINAMDSFDEMTANSVHSSQFTVHSLKTNDQSSGVQTPEAEEKTKGTVILSPSTEPVLSKVEELRINSAKNPVLSRGCVADAHHDTIGDKFTGAKTLHHKVAPPHFATISDKLHHKPIKDLKTAIGINEKFLFITRLFKGNLQHYSEAIDSINAESNLISAKDFIQSELASKFDWNNDDECVKIFIELVERRFID